MAATGGGIVCAEDDLGMSGGGNNAPPATTTISTIAVQSGNTRIVIALLQSKEWIQLKIQEMHPAMTDIGSNLKEVTELYQQHEKVLEKLQTKQSPVEELLRQADDLISTQKPRGEVYSAMAENLGLAWKDLNAQLEQRRQILEQAVAFFSKAEQFSDSMDAIQRSVSETFLPNTVESTVSILNRIKEERKVGLSNSMRMLGDGQLLLERLCEVATHSMGDSRPEHMRPAARLTAASVERRMEAEMDRWRDLEAAWAVKKGQLEQCLARCQLEKQLGEAEYWLRTKGSEFVSEHNLGDSLASSEILLHEHHKIENACKERQEHCLKLVKCAEDLQKQGNYAGEELRSKSYLLLSECADLMSTLDQRRQLLVDTVNFFTKAQTAQTKLDQIEIQLSASESTAALWSTAEEVANSAIQDGRRILGTTGMTEPGAQGVARKVEELEWKKKKLCDLCKAKESKVSEKTAAFKKFCEKYDELIKWLSNNGQFFVQRTRDMGTTQTAAKAFLDQHETLQNDLRMKFMEAEALLRTVPNLVRSGGEEAEVVHSKSENLKQQFAQLRTTFEKRILVAQRYLAFLKLSTKVSKEMDELEALVKQAVASPDQLKFRSIEEKQFALRQEFLQMNNNGKNFLEDARKVDDMYLNMTQPCATVEDILNRLELRNVSLNTQWLNLQNEITATKETLIYWDHLLKDSNRVLKCSQDLERKLFPVIPQELYRPDTILTFLEKRMSDVLPQIKSVQKEIEALLKKSETLKPKDSTQAESVRLLQNLQDMNQTLQRRLTDYQILVSMMITFFKNHEELEKLVDMQESQFRMTSFPSDVTRLELLMHDHESSKPTVMELFKFSYTELQQLIKKINESEPPEAAAKDTEKLSTIHGSRKQYFVKCWEEYKYKLEQHNQLCIFFRDMHLINQQIEDLNSQMASIRQTYGESLPSAMHTSEAFHQFEKTIEILQIRIQEFVSTAERLMRDQRVDTGQVYGEIETLQRKWSTFRTEVTTNRRLIDVAIEYYKIVEEAEEWLQEGSRLLISVARKSSTCIKESDADGLQKEIKDFLTKGKPKQEERLKKISALSQQLYGNQAHPSTNIVTNKNKDMLDSFTVINTELNTLTSNIKFAQQAKIAEQKGKEEMDAALHAAQAEAETARAAAAAALQAARAAEAAVSKPQQRSPRFLRMLLDAEVPEGTRHTFECEVDGEPAPQVQWFKDGILVENNPDYQTSVDRGVCKLTIEETFSEDTAKFTCRAANPAGVAETQSQLIVKESRTPSELIPPHFVQEPADSTVAEFESHLLDCQVFGNPLPLVSWFKDDACIDYSTDYSISYNNGHCSLRIEEASLDHQGRYTCRAVNPVGQVACSANILVQTTAPSERPTFVSPLSNVMARAGQKLRLECSISGQPQVSWLHNSKSLKETRDTKLHFDGCNATLVITEAFPKDAGTYTIIARNKAGEAVSSCNVSVKGRLPMETSDSEIASDIEPAKPQVKQQLDDQTVSEGNKVRMDCIIVGQPEPEVIWYHNGKPVKESDDFQLLFEGDRCTLIIEVAYLEDAGQYRCVAINSGGEASSSCHLKVEPAMEIIQKSSSQFSQKDILVSIEKCDPPKFLKLLDNVIVTEGQEVMLECQVAGEPGTTLNWLKDGQQLSNTPECQISSDASGISRLRIPSARASDRGTYSARAHNKGGEAQSICSVFVSTPLKFGQTSQQAPPTFLQHVANQTLVPGGTARFETLVEGTPNPQVRWNFQGKPVPRDQHHDLGSDGDKKHWLVVKNIGREHAGRYSAIAENDVGIATTSALLSIDGPSLEKVPICEEYQAQSMIMTRKAVMQTSTISSMSEVSDADYQPPEFPSFSSLQSQQLVKREQSTFIQRRVEQGTTPAPAIQVPVMPAPVAPAPSIPAPVPVIQPTVAQPIVLQAIQPQPIQQPAAPQSEVLPKQVEVFPKFTRPVTTAVVTEGEKLFLEAQYEGVPEPTIQWFKDDVELKNKPGLQVTTCLGGRNTCLFVIKSTESDSGRYSCIASNSAGKATSIAEVKVKPYCEAPKFKKKLQASVVKSGSRLELEVEATGVPVPDVKWYRNENQLKDSPDFRISSSANTHTLVISEVFPEDSGTYMVVASNLAGETKCLADLIVEEDRSPEEDKRITYQEFSSVQQTKQMFTKLSTNAEPALEPLQCVTEIKSIEAPPLPPKIPSPPPMPAVSVKVWTQPKPQPFTPAITETQEPIPIPSPEPEQIVPTCQEFSTRTSEEPLSTQPTKPASFVSGMSESFVKQSIMKFSQPEVKQQSKSEEAKTSVTFAPAPVVQNGVHSDMYSSTSTVSQSTVIFDSKSMSTVASGYPPPSRVSQVPKLSFVPKTLTSGLVSESEKKPTKVWQPKATPELKSTPQISKKTTEELISPPHNFPQSIVTDTFHSSTESKAQPTETTPFSSGGGVEKTTAFSSYSGTSGKTTSDTSKNTSTTSCQTSTVPSPSFYSSESSTTTRTSYSTEEISITKKYEVVMEHSSEVVSDSDASKVVPKPIIKKEVDQKPRPKKEVVIEEVPVVGAEVKPPHFAKPLQDISANEKDSVCFECEIQGIPQPTIRWFKNHNMIAASEDYQMSMSKDGICLLRIPEAYPEDSGKYTCTATNISGCHTTSAYLTVQPAEEDENMVIQPPSPQLQQGHRPLNASPPIFEKPPTMGRFIEGGDAHFECRVSGNPQPEVVWSRRGMPIKNDNRRCVAYTATTGMCLFDIKGLTAEDDGEYTCTAVNCAGEASLTVHIQRDVRGQIGQDTFHQVQAPMSHIQSTQIAQQQRNISGAYVQSYVQQQQHTDGMFQRTTSADYEMDPSCPMYYSGTESFRVDTFEYRLLRELEFRESLFRKLPGEDAPEKAAPLDKAQSPSAPQIIARPRNSKLLEGSEATFQAKISGNPKPKITWFRNGQRIVTSQRFKTSYTDDVATLHIHMALPEDAGYYTLLAENANGRIACSAHLVIEGVGVPVSTTTFHQQLQQQQRSYAPVQPSSPLPKSTAFGYQSEQQVSFAQRTAQTKVQSQTISTSNLYSQQVQQQYAAANTTNLYSQQQQSQQQQQQQQYAASNVTNLYSQQQQLQQQHAAANQYSQQQIQSAATNQQQQQAATNLYQQQQAATNQYQLQQRQAATNQYQQQFSSNLNQNLTQTTDSFSDTNAATAVRTVQEDDTGASRALKPNFVKVPGDKEVTEGKMVRFDLRVSGRPFPDVLWYLNGKKVVDDATHKLLVNEGGVHALMITTTNRTDAGAYTCVAKNKSGETTFNVNLHVIEKEQIVAPKFVERFQSLHVREGEPVTLHCRAIGTPAPNITWQKDGVQIHSQPPEIIIETNEGATTIYFNKVNILDSAWYQCTAQNQAGSTATRARLYVDSESAPIAEPWRLNLPRPQKVICPEGSPPREVVWLKPVERAAPRQRAPEEDRPPQKPAFTTHIRDLTLQEGDRAHFDARLVPIGDPTMVIEWYVNGKQVEASSRVMTTYNFGYVALTLLHVYAEDSGVYMCRAINDAGEATTTATLRCVPRAKIERAPQHPESMDAIRHLEDHERYGRQELVEESVQQLPVFVRPLHSLENLQEGQFAHFEGQITPVSDPAMRVEWLFNGQALTAGTRISTTFSFGYVALNISYVRAEDSGVYMCKATNQKGEAISTATLKVKISEQVTSSLGIPEQQSYIQKTQELEAYQMQQRQTYVEVDQTVRQKPTFKTHLLEKVELNEGKMAHFEARLEPSGDSTMRVEWMKDGRPVEASSRISTFFNFGYVSLTIRGVDARDTGTYTCVATNCMGNASTTTKFTCISTKSILVETQHSEGLEKIQHLEDYSRYQRDVREDVTTCTSKPIFTSELIGKNQLVEGQSAHFETRLEPMGDPTMTVEWYFNGRSLTTGHRFKTYFDFGYVALDILYVFPEDTGTFSVVAKNALGQTTLSKQVHVQAKSSVDTSTIHEIEEKIEYLERPQHVDTGRFIEEISKCKPHFPIPLHSPKPLREGERVHIECRVEPVGDPTLTIEWFFNGKALPSGSRFQTKHDFGLIVLDITTAYPEDTGEYTVRATNHLGSAHTSACITVIGKSGVVSETQQTPEGLQKIQHLEDSSRYRRDQFEETIITQLPTFTKPLHNIETIEGSNIHLECRLAPVGDPTMTIEWLVNGAPLKVGHRFRPAFEFDYVALDILSVYAEDSGVYTCKATSSLGQAVTSCTVKCTGRSQIILESQHPEGLQQIQYLEDQSRHRRETWIEESAKVQPKFLSKLSNLNLHEGQLAHFECRLEPVNDSSLRVEWFRNGRSLPVGHRYRPFHDFGYVALNILSVVPEDTGTYSCRAVNTMGTAEIQATLTCSGKSSIISDTQHPEGLQKIQHLEDYSRHTRDVYQEELTSQSPVFTKAPQNVEIKEGQRVHLECRLIPVGDPKLKVEWFHNGRPVKHGTRFVHTFNFGYVALDIMYAYPEDSGTYTCKAVNALGEAVTSATLKCLSKSSLILESQQPESLQKIQQLEDMSRHQRSTYIEETTTQAPVFTQAMKNLQLVENQSAHFECRLIPVGDNKLKVEWFHNGLAIMPASRVTLTHDFGFVALDLAYVKPEDSGTYTCKATNELGQAVCSATLAVRGSNSLLLETQHPEGLQKIQYLEDTSRHQRQAFEDVRVTSAPVFVTPLSGPNKLVEGHSSHLECRIEPYPDPTMKIEWFFNGKPLPTGSRYRTMFDFGFAALDILTVYAEDSGEYSIKATNSLGTSSSSAKINVTAKKSLILESQQPDSLQKIRALEDHSRFARPEEPEQMFDKPNFGRPLYNLDALVEGQRAHLEATLTPVNDPTMRVEWFHNGVPIKQAHRFKTTCDFGYVALDILYVFAEDSGTYMCKATNRVGEAITTCSIKVQAKGSIYTDTLHEEGLQKIRALEEHYRPTPEEAVVPVTRPVFLTPLKSQENIKEGQPVHLECKLEPVNDPKLKVEWYVNGIEIKAGHRFRTIHDFGYVALDILYSYAEDNGTYMCKAVNELGEAVTTCSVKVEARRNIYYDTQHPEGLEKIRELECQTKYQPIEVDEKPICKPYFISELRGITEYTEGDSAHFECRVEPTHDPELKVEFFHNGKPIDAASRFHVTLDFGYVALDISHMYPRDAGQYTVKVSNRLGEATSSLNVQVISKSGIISDTQHPEGLAKIQVLEDESRRQPQEFIEKRTFQRPVFTAPLQNLELVENQSAHLECRLIPVGDPTLTVEWFFNEKPLQPSSRVQTTHDFGYVALDIQYARPDDVGIYTCRAKNELGEAVTTASIKVQTKAFIELQSHHPEGLEKIQELENFKQSPTMAEPEKAFEKPVFTKPLYGPAEVVEGMPAHFECRVVPIGDPDLKIQWFVNGVALKQASRFREIHDFGMVTLDIASTIAEDSGVYMCKAVNKAGEAVTSTSMVVRARGGVLGESQHPEAYIQLQRLEMGPAPTGEPEVAAPKAPFFTEHLVSHDQLVEGQYVHLEARVEPANDEKLKIEWYKNGKTLVFGTRIRTTCDFGLVSLDIVTVRPDDSGIYTCRAVNEVGEAITTCSMKVEDRESIIYRSQHPESLPKILELESSQAVSREEHEAAYEKPVFITHLNNLELKEGTAAHFECRVEPYRDPTLKIEFQLNGKSLPAATRFTASKDFGYITLDISHTLAEDAGIYTCKATNNKGQAVTTGSLKIIDDNEYVIERTTHPMGQEGLSKVREVEEMYLSKYQTRVEDKELQYPKPVFVVPLQDKYTVNESESVRLDCRVEPAADPKLCVEWFFNGKSLNLGTRFQLTNDFGQVVLASTDMWGRDSGVYTCRAYNAMGEAFTSTTIHCAAKGTIYEGTLHPEGEKGLESIQTLEESLLRQTDQAITEDKGHPPIFTSHFQNLINLTEGDIAHFEATLAPAGDQTMVVEWFFNGKVLKAGHRIRTVHAFGMVVLEILGVVIEDSGDYTCKATNKWGKAEITVQLECVDKVSGQKPKFTTQLQSLTGLKEGESAHFECHLVPIGDPAMRVEWFHNGVPMRHSSRIKTLSDFGFVVMDISFVHVEDSGDYVCVATNKFGSDTTRCSIQCTGHGKIFRDTLQPQSLEKIAELEGSHSLYRTQLSMDSKVTEAPKFTTQIKEITSLVEGQSAHFEAYLTPTNDPNLKIEWFFNGKLLGAGHRFRTFHDFGIVILDILYCYGEDSGEYMCKATNNFGTDITKTRLTCRSKKSIILDPQIPKEMADSNRRIMELEEHLHRSRTEHVEELQLEAPRFTVPLENITDLREGENAHLEARLTPTDDPDLRVEWFKNSKALKAGTRIRTINDFGFVVLEISPVYPEDSGLYSCRAINKVGEAVTTCTLKCSGKRSIIMDTQLPSGMESMEKIARFEDISSARIAEQWMDIEVQQPPKFLSSPQDLTLPENTLAHFECKLTPMNDPTMKVEWYHNGKSLITGSRVKTINDFGFVILEVAGVFGRDAGVYMCKATNAYGEATVSCKLSVKAKGSIIMEPQLPAEWRSGTESLQRLEESMYRTEEMIIDDDRKLPPKFITQIQNLESKVEGESAHFECRLEPVGDPTMRVEWFINGKPLTSGTRVHTVDDFGFVVLDIDWLFPRDAGEFMCRATNKWGQDTTNAVLKIKSKRDIIMDSQLPEGMSSDKLRELDFPPQQAPPLEEVAPQPPKFTTQIQPQENLQEGDSAHFECKLTPLNDPKLRVEWYHNGKPLKSGHRFKTTHDFGFVALDVLYVYAEDSGEYTARAVNDYGEDTTRTTLKVKAQRLLEYRTQLPKSMETGVQKIAEMEASWQRVVSEEDVPAERCRPTFVMKPEPQVVVEGEWAKFCCRVIGNPRPRLMWILNGNTVGPGSRYKLTYDGIYHLDIPKSRQYDQGKVEVFARNGLGEAYCWTTLEVRPRHDDYRVVLKNSPRPWYDAEIKSYQKVRTECELEKVFEEKLTPGGTKIDVWKTKEDNEGDHVKQIKRLEEEDTKKLIPEVKRYKSEAIYIDKATGERRTEEQSQVLYLAKNYESQAEIDNQRVQVSHLPSSPQESSVYGKEVHVSKQKQTQKEQKGDLEITRHKTVTETREQEHKAVTKERKVVGVVPETKPPMFTKKIEPCRAFEGESGQFSCVFTGSPAPHITWFRENFPIKDSQDFQINTTDTTSSLVIREVYLEDSGVFSVKAENRGGTAKSSANLVVEERKEQVRGTIPPSFVRTIQDTTAKVGQLVRLDAVIAGSKPLDVYWLKNGKKVVQDITHKTLEEEDKYMLMILEATQEDVGPYECVAINKVGEARCQANVQVTAAPLPKAKSGTPKKTEKNVKAPECIEPLKDATVKESQPAVFRCRFSGTPVPQVKWFRGEIVVKQSRYFRMSVENDVYTLRISEAFPEDEGLYKCVATNTAGTASTSANLRVVVPEVTEVPPSLSPLADLTVPEGSPARFVTTVTGTPTPKIIWYREGTVVKASHDFQMFQDGGSCSLVIRQTYPEDEGVYTCRATNASGQAETSARLTVESKR